MSDDKRVPDRVSKGVPTGGQFAASARGESTVRLADATATSPGAVTPQIVLDAMRDYVADRTFDVTLEERLKTALPALAATGAVDDYNFKRQMVHPLTAAIAQADTETIEDLTARIADLEAADRAYLDSGWTLPGVVDITDRDNIHGARHTGSLYDSSRPLTEVAKTMRADIKAAQAAGYLPADLTFRVTTDSSGNGAITTTIQGLPDERAFWRNPDSEYKSPGARFHTQPSWEAMRLRDRVERIGSAYAYSQSSGMTDHFNVSHHVFSTVESEREALWRAQDKEMAGLRSAFLAERKKNPKAPYDPIQTLDAQRKEMAERHAAELAAKREADREKWDW